MDIYTANSMTHIPTSEHNVFPYLLQIQHLPPLSPKLKHYRYSAHLTPDSKVTTTIKLVYDSHVYFESISIYLCTQTIHITICV